MKNLYIAIITLLCMHTAVAQEATSVEKSLLNIQAGAVGAWVNYEARLSNKWALRTEIGIDLWSFESTNSIGTKETNYFFLPSIAVEPRWYYNIQKRANKGRDIANNSANFVTLAVEYYSDALKIGAPGRVKILDQITFIPKWGIRRSIAKSNFNYEVGIGVGPVLYFENDPAYKNSSDVAIDGHVRIGYTFK